MKMKDLIELRNAEHEKVHQVIVIRQKIIEPLLLPALSCAAAAPAARPFTAVICSGR